MKTSRYKHTKKESRIGILGGSFDPAHKAHIALASDAQKEFKLDRIYFVPAKYPPHKLGLRLASVRHRITMLKLAIKPYKQFRICYNELSKRKTTYSFQTARYFKKRFPKAKLFFIMGSDSLNDLQEWKSPKILKSLCTLIVASRKGMLHRKKNNKYTDIAFTKRTLPAISSSIIRAYCANHKQISSLVPKSVQRYISRNDLYVR